MYSSFQLRSFHVVNTGCEKKECTSSAGPQISTVHSRNSTIKESNKSSRYLKRGSEIQVATFRGVVIFE